MVSIADLLKLSPDELMDLFGKAFSQRFSTTTYKFNPSFLYRGRPNWDGKLNISIELFENVIELWAPPQCPDLRQGRCNKQGQSLFYSTNHATAIFFELGCSPGDKLTIGAYKCKEDLKPLGIVGARKIALINSQYKDIFANHYQNADSEGQKLHDFVDGLFSAPGSIYYNTTNAITSIFLNDNFSVPLPSGFTSPDNMNGLIYSSVATQLNCYNIAFQPEYAKAVLKPIQYHKYEILARPTSHHFKIALTHSSKEVKANGDIVWDEQRPPKIEYITDLRV